MSRSFDRAGLTAVSQTIIYRTCLAILLGWPCASFADTYAHIDDNGAIHISDVQVDSRYFLFRRSIQQVDPPEAASPTGGMQMTHPVFVDLSERIANKRYGALIAQVAREHDMDPALIHAVVAVESGFDTRARSSKGAGGLMQLMPATAERYGVLDVWDPLQNLRGGTRYLRDLLSLFKNNVSLALAAYNAGENAVMRAGNAIPAYRETRIYVPKVMELTERLRVYSADRP